jgi:cell division protein ZapA
MSWQQSIKIIIAGREYPFKINHEEEEERIRKAGRLINERLIQYKQRFSDRDVQDFLALEALRLAIKTFELEAKAGSTEQADKLKQLDEQISAFLKQCEES